MGKHSKKKKISGFTVCVLIMFLSTIWYILYQSWFYDHYETFLPMELTYGFFAVYCFETVSLARLSIAKNKGKLPEKAGNPALEMLGLYSAPDFEPDVQEIQKENEEKGMDNELARTGA